MDWHGLATIGKLANLCWNKKLAPDWHRIGMDWHGLAWIGTIQNQSDPFFAIQHQSGANLMLVQRQPFDPILTLQFRKMVNQSQS